MGQGGRATVVCYALCTFTTVFPNTGMSVRLKQLRHRGNTCVVRDLRGSTGAQCGAAGWRLCQKHSTVRGYIELWWTLNTNCSPADIQGQGSYCETRIRSQSGKRFEWKWNQIMSWGLFGQQSPSLRRTLTLCNWFWQNGTGDMQPHWKLWCDYVVHIASK